MSGEGFRDLEPTESQLTGQWLEGQGGSNGDAVEQRIRWLTAKRLVALGTASGGWDWLFRDPRDGRLWELTFPLGSIHGSGPRRLAVISPADARSKYETTST
jgi:hypothetical protein